MLAAAGLAPATACAVEGTLRVATFNCSLNRPEEGGLRRALATPGDAQARAVAEIIQRVRPDILLLEEFDYDAGGESMAEFQRNYLSGAHEGASPIEFRHTFTAESNTGEPSGFDLDHDGHVG